MILSIPTSTVACRLIVAYAVGTAALTVALLQLLR
jgi:hypothetical protein